jgi:cell division protein FtsW
MISIARTDRGAIAEWWWTIDRVTLAAVLALVVGGVVFLLAASPAVALRFHLDSFHFVERQLIFVPPALAIMVAVSFLTPREIRRVAMVCYFGGLALMCLTLLFGEERNGAYRWLDVGPIGGQPSEFAKAGFVVLSAWMLAEAGKGSRPALGVAVILIVVFAGLLVLQPDFGQTLLISVVWAALFFMAGMPLLWVVGTGSLAAGGAVAAYVFLPHVASRVDRFLDPKVGDNFQVDKAYDAFANGGFIGVGPGEGHVKYLVPDAHTDFIFSVIGEEFGALTCLIIAGLYAVIVIHGLARSMSMRDSFTQLASAGLISMIGLQALINMAVNLNLMPAKGMTLPFVSYGGSSLLAVAIAVGMIIALTRRRPHTVKRSHPA